MRECQECQREATKTVPGPDQHKDTWFCDKHFALWDGKFDPTSKEWKDACGMCTACWEWTLVIEPCCNAPVEFEGSTYTLDEFYFDE